jgi:hypothetical protein
VRKRELIGSALGLLLLSAFAMGCGGGAATTGAGRPASAPETGRFTFYLSLDNDDQKEEVVAQLGAYYQRPDPDAPWAYRVASRSGGSIEDAGAHLNARLAFGAAPAILEYDDVAYELGGEDFAEDGGASPCSTWLERLQLEDLIVPRALEEHELQLEGEAVREVTGALDVSVARRVMRDIASPGACGPQLEMVPNVNLLLAGLANGLGREGFSSRVDVRTAEDGRLRRLFVRAFLRPQQPDADEWDSTLEVTLAENVGNEPDPLPSNPLPFSALRRKLGSANAPALRQGAAAMAGLLAAAPPG